MHFHKNNLIIMIINFYFDIIWESKVTALLLDGVSPELYLWNPKLFRLLKRDFFLSSWKMILTSVCVVIWDANSFTWTDNVVQCNINEVQILIVIFYIHQSFSCYCIFFCQQYFLLPPLLIFRIHLLRLVVWQPCLPCCSPHPRESSKRLQWLFTQLSQTLTRTNTLL